MGSRAGGQRTPRRPELQNGLLCVSSHPGGARGPPVWLGFPSLCHDQQLGKREATPSHAQGSTL